MIPVRTFDRIRPVPTPARLTARRPLSNESFSNRRLGDAKQAVPENHPE